MIESASTTSLEPIAKSDYETERGKPTPNTPHSAIQANLIILLSQLLGEDFRVLSELTLDTLPTGSTPDVCVYPFFELEFFNQPARNPEPPILTIEVLSPSQNIDDMVEKTVKYFEFGVQSSWIIVPSLQSVLVFHAPQKHAYFHDTEFVFDKTLDLKVPLKRIFR